MNRKIWGILGLILMMSSAFALRSGAQTDPAGIAAASSTDEAVIPSGPSRDELEAKIHEKSQVLEKINKDMEATSQNLLSAKQEKSTLQKQLQSIQTNISQLELGIKSDNVTSQKLGLEIDSMQYDIRDIENTINDKSDAISYVLREIQKTTQNGNGMLMIVLRNGSLADSVMEAQSLKNLRSQLAIDIKTLAKLQDDLGNKLTLISTKKMSIEQHQKNLGVKKLIAKDQQEERSQLLQQTKSKESTYQKQLDELKKQQDAIEDEISAVEDQLRASFDVSVLPGKRRGVMTWPVQMKAEGGNAIITQHFGERSYLYRGKPHNGLDIGAPVGTPVYAAMDGVVTRVDNNDRSSWAKYQYGKYVMLRHGNNLSTLYAHLSRQIVAAGATVKRGELIGYMGATGYATGPHLHFGVYWTPSVQFKGVPPAAGLVPIGVIINPEDYL